MKIVIIGGVAAGAGAAARLRRLDETAEIVLLERGPYISYANCGLPYHVGDVIPARDSLLVMPAGRFKSWFEVDVRVNSEVLSIDRDGMKVEVRGPDGVYMETYDKLLIATGSSPVKMRLPGGEDPRVTRLWTIPDMDGIIAKIDGGAKRALVVGAGFIGLEAAENLNERGLEVTIVELMDQVLPTVDKEMATPLEQELSASGISLRLGRKVEKFEEENSAVSAVLDDGSRIPSDLVLMCVGVKPNSEIAKDAGLVTGPRGHIVVDDHLRTSDPNIFAAGDVIEVVDAVCGGKSAIPLAGPANKQARIVADNITGRSSKYDGSYGASIIKIGSLTAASVGATERRLKQAGMEYQKIYAHLGSSASYYPGAEMMKMKLLFAGDGKILGAQIVGAKGADKRIDVIATAMRCGVTASGLTALELSYAPPFNSAKDPVNMLGMIADDVLNGDSRPVHSDAIPAGALLVDVCEPEEFQNGPIPGFINIPLGKLRSRLGELDKTRKVVVACAVGQRGFFAERILRQNGFDSHNLSGGYATWKLFNPPPLATSKKVDGCGTDVVGSPELHGEIEVIDARAMACPGPVVRLKQRVDKMAEGEAVKMLAALSFEPDLKNWIASTGNTLASINKEKGFLEAVVRKACPAPALKSGGALSAVSGHGVSIVLFSNDFDKVMAAMIIACGMAASGARVGIFFTFWGLSALRRNLPPATKKNFVSHMFGAMLPKGADKLKLSKMNMGGMGIGMMKQVMASQNVTTLPDLIKQARELGVKFVACEMAMNVMGLTREELIDIDEVAGVASFVEMAKNSNNTLFI